LFIFAGAPAHRGLRLRLKPKFLGNAAASAKRGRL
jgi:hypothetical protein